MAGTNGADIVLAVENPVGSGTFVVVGSQRNVQLPETREEIDMSSKDSDKARWQYGRYSARVVLDKLWVPGNAEETFLRNALRNKTVIKVQRQEAGVAKENADALVLEIGQEAPDQQASTFSVTIRIDGIWVPA